MGIGAPESGDGIGDTPMSLNPSCTSKKENRCFVWMDCCRPVTRHPSGIITCNKTVRIIRLQVIKQYGCLVHVCKEGRMLEEARNERWFR